MTAADRARLAALVEAASPGPWAVLEHEPPREIRIKRRHWTVGSESTGFGVALAFSAETGDGNRANADYIAAVDPPTVRALLAHVAALEGALAPFVRFIEQFDRQPIRGIDDEFYAIHTGTEYAAGLKLSEFRALRALLRGPAGEPR